jgi:hypothetical protein
VECACTILPGPSTSAAPAAENSCFGPEVDRFADNQALFDAECARSLLSRLAEGSARPERNSQLTESPGATQASIDRKRHH